MEKTINVCSDTTIAILADPVRTHSRSKLEQIFYYILTAFSRNRFF